MSTDTPRKPRSRATTTPPPVTDPPPPNTLEPGAGRFDQKIATQGSQKTWYRISTILGRQADPGVDNTLWKVAGDIEAADAKTAVKIWAEQQGESFAGGEVEAVPVRNITSVTVGVETRRQLTIT